MVVSDEFIEKYSWMVRPCHLYKEEYSDCTSMKSRFHQHFVQGSFCDCGPWKRDYNNCTEWTDNENRKAFKELIDSELARRRERLSGHLINDTWEKRSEQPPPGWNDPLPEHIEKRIKNSYLAIKADQLKEGSSTSSSLCVIS